MRGRRVVPSVHPWLPARKPCAGRGRAGEGRSGGAAGDNRLPESAVPEAGAYGEVWGGATQEDAEIKEEYATKKLLTIIL